MSYLINRNPSGRIICLHALLKYLYKRFQLGEFRLNDLKYDHESALSILQECTLLVKYPSIPHKVCPYLENELSRAKCYLTQSLQHDTQKSKSASDAFNALEGMGLIERLENNSGKITSLGIKFCSEEYYSIKMLNIIRESLLSYGPFVGLLYQISSSGTDLDRSTISLGYPQTNERVSDGTRYLSLSTGSQPDTITRTRSVLLAWASTAGYLLPNGINISDKNKCHIDILDYIKSKKWTKNKYKICLPSNLFLNKWIVDNPLSYNAMTKKTGALRERNQDEERNLTLKYERIIRNRRFAIVYALAIKSGMENSLNFRKFIEALKTYQDDFVINGKEFEDVMDQELGIALLSGIPFKRKRDELFPLTYLNIDKLKLGADIKLIEILDDIIKYA